MHCKWSKYHAELYHMCALNTCDHWYWEHALYMVLKAHLHTWVHYRHFLHGGVSTPAPWSGHWPLSLQWLMHTALDSVLPLVHFWLHRTVHCAEDSLCAGGRWVHPQGDMHMIAARLGCQSAMVGTGWTNSCPGCIHRTRLQTMMQCSCVPFWCQMSGKMITP